MKCIKLLIILVFVLSLLLVSCTSSRPLVDIDFHKGTNGVNFEMLGLLKEIYENNYLEINVNVFNEGAYDVPQQEGYLNIGLEKEYVCVYDEGAEDHCSSDESSIQDFGLRGRNVLNPKGDFTLKTYGLWIKKIDPQSYSHDAVITATVCYDYMNDLMTEVCIDPHFYDLSPVPKACEVKDLNFDSQGSPLAIEKIEVKMMAEGKDNIKPMFLIHIKNKGRGEVVHKDKIKDVCSASSLSYKSFNVVHLKNVEYSGGKYKYNPESGENTIECTVGNEKETRLKDGIAVIKCTTATAIPRTDETYVAQLKVELEYGYTESKSEKITIKKAVTY